MTTSHFDVERQDVRDYTKRDPTPFCPFMGGRSCQPNCRFYSPDNEDCLLRRMVYEVMQYCRFLPHV